MRSAVSPLCGGTLTVKHLVQKTGEGGTDETHERVQTGDGTAEECRSSSFARTLMAVMNAVEEDDLVVAHERVLSAGKGRSGRQLTVVSETAEDVVRVHVAWNC